MGRHRRAPSVSPEQFPEQPNDLRSPCDPPTYQPAIRLRCDLPVFNPPVPLRGSQPRFRLGAERVSTRRKKGRGRMELVNGHSRNFQAITVQVARMLIPRLLLAKQKVGCSQ
jgi:hypothetical protein